MAANTDFSKLASMSVSQASLYTIDDERDSGCPFANDQTKTMAYFPHTTVIAPVLVTEMFSYDMDSAAKFDFLLLSALDFKTVPVKVKPEFQMNHRIAWTPDLGFNIVESAELVIDGDVHQTLTASSLKHAFQFFYLSNSDSHNKRSTSDRSNGNDPALTNWSTSLPETEIISEQPWSYSRGSIIAFPLNKLYPGLYKTLKQNYRFRLEIAQLLRMQRLVENEFGDTWVDIPFDKSILVMDNYPVNGELPVPSLLCEYISLSDEAADYFRECSEARFREFVVPTFTSFTSAQNSVFSTGAPISRKLVGSNPCTAIMWSVSDVNQEALNNRSANLTSLGREPIKSCTLNYTDRTEKFIFRREPACHFNRGIHMRKFRSAPIRPGFYGWSVALDSGSLDADSTIEFNTERQFCLDCELVQKLPEESSSEFRLDVTAVELKKYAIVPSDDGRTFRFEHKF